MKNRKKKQKTKHGLEIGVAWYTAEDFALLHQVAADRRLLENTYEQWLVHAEDAVRILKDSGYRVKTVDVDIAELVAWCRHENRPVDGESRSIFVEEKMERRAFSRKNR